MSLELCVLWCVYGWHEGVQTVPSLRLWKCLHVATIFSKIRPIIKIWKLTKLMQWHSFRWCYISNRRPEYCCCCCFSLSFFLSFFFFSKYDKNELFLVHFWRETMFWVILRQNAKPGREIIKWKRNGMHVVPHIITIICVTFWICTLSTECQIFTKLPKMSHIQKHQTKIV